MPQLEFEPGTFESWTYRRRAHGYPAGTCPLVYLILLLQEWVLLLLASGALIINNLTNKYLKENQTNFYAYILWPKESGHPTENEVQMWVPPLGSETLAVDTVLAHP